MQTPIRPHGPPLISPSLLSLSQSTHEVYIVDSPSFLSLLQSPSFPAHRTRAIVFESLTTSVFSEIFDEMRRAYDWSPHCHGNECKEQRKKKVKDSPPDTLGPGSGKFHDFLRVVWFAEVPLDFEEWSLSKDLTVRLLRRDRSCPQRLLSLSSEVVVESFPSVYSDSLSNELHAASLDGVSRIFHFTDEFNKETDECEICEFCLALEDRIFILIAEYVDYVAERLGLWCVEFFLRRVFTSGQMVRHASPCGGRCQFADCFDGFLKRTHFRQIVTLRNSPPPLASPLLLTLFQRISEIPHFSHFIVFCPNFVISFLLFNFFENFCGRLFPATLEHFFDSYIQHYLEGKCSFEFSEKCQEKTVEIFGKFFREECSLLFCDVNSKFSKYLPLQSHIIYFGVPTNLEHYFSSRISRADVPPRIVTIFKEDTVDERLKWESLQLQFESIRLKGLTELQKYYVVDEERKPALTRKEFCFPRIPLDSLERYTKFLHIPRPFFVNGEIDTLYVYHIKDFERFCFLTPQEWTEDRSPALLGEGKKLLITPQEFHDLERFQVWLGDFFFQ
jgi:hypothetical protein